MIPSIVSIVIRSHNCHCLWSPGLATLARILRPLAFRHPVLVLQVVEPHVQTTGPGQFSIAVRACCCPNPHLLGRLQEKDNIRFPVVIKDPYGFSSAWAAFSFATQVRSQTRETLINYACKER